MTMEQLATVMPVISSYYRVHLMLAMEGSMQRLKSWLTEEIRIPVWFLLIINLVVQFVLNIAVTALGL